MKRIPPLFTGPLMAVIFVAVSAVNATAATFTVTNTNDSGAGSLRQAVLNANAAAGSDTIVFDASFSTSKTIVLATVITINPANSADTLTITGPGANLLTLDGNNVTGILHTEASDQLLISSISFTRAAIGPAILSEGTLTVADAVFTSNAAGAINIATNATVTTVTNSVFTSNTDGNGAAIVMTADTLTVTNCTFTGNTATSSSATGLGGGAIYQNSSLGTTTITSSIFTGNQETGGSGGGGAVRNRSGTMNIINSSFTGNTSVRGGGALQGGGVTNISYSTFTGNSATGLNAQVSGQGSGGALSNQGGAQLTVTNSVIAGNSAVNSGGGIYYQPNSGAALMNIANTTISNNAANTNNTTSGGDGGGVYLDGGGSVTVTDSTISGNSVSQGNGGGFSVDAPLSLRNTIIANNAATGTGTTGNGQDVHTPDPINSLGYNLIENITNADIGGNTTGNIYGQDPNLGPLANNGGPTMTHALLAGSPAIDRGHSSGLTTDQRGEARPFDDPAVANAAGGDGSDIGAFEVRPASLQFSVANYSVGENSTTATITVTRTGDTQAASSVQYATGGGTATGAATCSAGVDYQNASGTLNFASGVTSQTFSVTICDDSVFEGDETVSLTLSNAIGAVLGSPNPAVLTIAENDAAPAAVQFSALNYNVQEDQTTVTITVNRIGNASGAVSVDYNTSDVTATERRDYIAAFGQIQFGAGETSKSFVVLINEDSFSEGTETFNVNLTNPTGAILGSPTISTVTITDDPAEPTTNVIDDAANYVSQHYHDFLNRQPDAPGQAFWTNEITSCGSNQQCIEIKRINVSAAFFLSIEFQQTGYLVERMYKAAYGDATGSSTIGGIHQLPVPIVRFNEFLLDTQHIAQGVIVGQGNWEQLLEQNKQAFAVEFVQRTRFTTALPTTLTPTQFVNQLFANAGVTPSDSDRNAAIAEFGAAVNTTDIAARARAFRRVAENTILFQQEFNRAFVLMQYFGYARRNPNDPQDSDYSGYEFWLTKLNQFNGNYVNAEMVKAFILSIEYRQRFAP